MRVHAVARLAILSRRGGPPRDVIVNSRTDVVGRGNGAEYAAWLAERLRLATSLTLGV
jgi:hypothetical protein